MSTPGRPDDVSAPYTLEALDITAYISLGHEARSGRPHPAHLATQRMAARFKSEEGLARYRHRKAIVEPVISWIKEALRFLRFSGSGAGSGAEHRRVAAPQTPRPS